MKSLSVGLYLVMPGVFLTLATAAPDDVVSPKIIMRSIRLLEEELRSATDAATKKAAGRKIIEVGRPLLEGEMAPANAAATGQAMKENVESGNKPEVVHQTYFAFWMVRAMGAVSADEETAGREAGSVLKTMGAMEAENDAVVNVMAALNIKGWLGGTSTTSRPNVMSERIHGLDDIFDDTLYDDFKVYSRAFIVSKVQQKLKEAGFYRNNVDGKPGAGTSAAIRAWQGKQQTSASGRLDGPTLESLGLLSLAESDLNSDGVWEGEVRYEKYDPSQGEEKLGFRCTINNGAQIKFTLRDGTQMHLQGVTGEGDHENRRLSFTYIREGPAGYWEAGKGNFFRQNGGEGANFELWIKFSTGRIDVYHNTNSLKRK
ncbi:MAG: peptidoglycan-binding domain-containing protein [Prosthecobacter sp.]